MINFDPYPLDVVSPGHSIIMPMSLCNYSVIMGEGYGGFKCLYVLFLQNELLYFSAFNTESQYIFV